MATLVPAPVTNFPDAMETEQLTVQRAISGDQLAMRALWTRHAPHIDVVVRRLVGHDPDLAAERARLGKEVATLASDIERTAKKLDNADFIARAPEEVVEENRERLADAQTAKAKLEAALSRLGAVV